MKKFNVLLAALGFVVFFYTFARLGWHNVATHLQAMGWGIVLVAALRLFSQSLFTYSWRWTFPHGTPSLPFWLLFRVRLAGEAINYLIPSASMGGEPVKAHLLKKHLPLSQALASVTVAKYSFILAQLVIMVLGSVSVLATVPLPPVMKFWILLPLAVISLGLGVLYIGQRRGMMGWLSSHLVRWKWDKGFLKSRLEKITRLDQSIAAIYRQQAHHFLLSCLLNMVGWAEGVVEVFLILLLLGLPASWHTAFLVESMSLIINATFFFVPWQAGTQESGKVLIFQILGLGPAAGFALGIIRRIRELLWAGLGLLCLATLKENDERRTMNDELWLRSQKQ